MVDFEPIDADSIPDPIASDSTPNGEGKRRGRPPGSGRLAGPRTPRRTAADKANVELAIASMDTLYSAGVTGLLLFGRPSTSEMLAARIEQTQAANRKAFEASPRLAESVAKLGAVSSVGLFIGSNVTLVAAVLLTLRMESYMVQQQQQAEQQADQQ